MLPCQTKYLLVRFSYSILKLTYLIIERSDFEENAPKDFRRLTPAQPVGLKYGEIVVSVKKVHKSGNTIVKLDVEATPADKATKVRLKPK